MSSQVKTMTILVAIATVVAFATVLTPVSDADASEETTYQFYLCNSVDGEDSSINGWITASGTTPVSALCKALDDNNISYSGFDANTANVTFNNTAKISDWTCGAWASDGEYYAANYAIWNYNAEDGWHIGNVFGSDCGMFEKHDSTSKDTAFIISHAKHLDATGNAAKELGIDVSAAWADPTDYGLVYDGTTGGYANAKMAMIAWNTETYGWGSLANYGISASDSSVVIADATSGWISSYDPTKVSAPAGYDLSGLQYGYVQLSPQDLSSTPENVLFGPGQPVPPEDESNMIWLPIAIVAILVVAGVWFAISRKKGH